jgi:mono/diheme cytochrome c family protein
MQTQQPTKTGRRSHATGTLLLGAVALLSPGIAGAAPPRIGEQTYRQTCARCHGPSGEGTKENYPKPLAGDKSVAQLARLIARTMPDDDPGTCKGEDAERVAAYIYDAFYSRTAQARNKPARVELSRLTVRQYRNAVADLVGTFRPAPGRWDEQRGLHGEYFKGRRFRPGERVLERLDPSVRFDYGTDGPAPEKFDPYEFSIRWEGAVLAPETGEYEFIVRTEHAARLWVNDTNHPLIDAWVKSGSDTEFRATVTLLGGRAYPLRLEFSKAKQGVDDSKNNSKKPPVKASVALLWKPPQRAADVIPPHNLSPNRFPETFVLAAAFPPDDRSTGWERGTTVSKAWDQATTEAAIETADYVARHLRELAGLGPTAARGPGSGLGNPASLNADAQPGSQVPAAEQAKKLRAFAAAFAERAFRRPLTPEQQKLYIEHQFETVPDPEAAVKRVVMLVLKSPRFLYREIDGRTDGYDVASRLSFGLWDSLPDNELLEAAKSGRLATREQVARQAERMLADLRARSKVHDFLFGWLKVEQAPDLAKDGKRFPGFDPAAAADLRTSLELFLEDVVWGPASDFRQLLLSDTLYLNGRLARLYGGDLPADAPFAKVPASGQRAGVLTHPYLLATFAYTSTSSPIHRGVFLARNVLGQTLRPPPEAFTPLPAEQHPQLTTRERVALQTKPQSCQSCHNMINPLGFTLESFDAIGRFRDKEDGKPVDTTGGYQTRSGELVKFAGVRDLATFLAGSEEVHEAFVEQLFHSLVQQPVRAYGPQELADLRRSFEAGGFSVRRLMVEIMTATALTGRQGKL